MNKVIMIGNLVKDPEANQTGTGITMCKFTIAINRSYVNANNERDVDFFNVVTWRGLAENCAKFLSKGKKVAVTGSLQNRSYEDKDGVKKFFTDIVADDVEFLSPKDQDANYNQNQNNNNNANNYKSVSDLKPIESDDLPF